MTPRDVIPGGRPMPGGRRAGPTLPGPSGDDGGVSGSTGSTGRGTADRRSPLGRRVLTIDDSAPRFLASATDGAPRWAAGLAAGLQAAILSLAVVVAPTLAAFVATSADPSNSEVGWLQSVAVGAGIWLLGHGVPLHSGGVAITLMPLGITMLAVFSCYASARRSGQAAWSGFATALGGYLAVVLGVALAVSPGPAEIVRAVVGGAVIGVLGLGAGLLARPGAPSIRDLSRPLWTRVPGVVREGAVAGVLAVVLLVGVAALVVVAWIVVGRESVSDVASSLALDAMGGTVLAVAQLALLPDLVVWALAYVAGPGFVVGAGSFFTPATIVVGPLPALPLLGALPGPSSTNQLTAWWPVALVLVGAVAGWWLHARLTRGEWWHPVFACGVAAAVAALGSGVLVTLGSGSAGPGRMTEVGASGMLVGLAVAAGVLVGIVLVVLPSSVELRAEIGRAWRRLRHGDGLDDPREA